MKKAIFLDRDGVVNRERGEYTFAIADFELNEGLVEFCRKAQENNYLLIIISNQGGIAKGLYTLEDVHAVHAFLQKELAKDNVRITDFFICPHHQDYGACLCRKPNTLLLEKAIAKYGLDKQQSFMIGDKERDVEAAKNAGIEGILIESNTDLRNLLKRIH